VDFDASVHLAILLSMSRWWAHWPKTSALASRGPKTPTNARIAADASDCLIRGALACMAGIGMTSARTIFLLVCLLAQAVAGLFSSW